MHKKSVKKNAIYNVIRVLMTIVFPLITFPYATRILGADNIGKVQFSASVVSYFSLIAALGIGTYGMREGAAVRKDREKFSKLASEIFTINLITTVLSYVLLFVTVCISDKLQEYNALIAIQGITIIMNTIGVEWIYSAFEDYFYITVRSIATQAIGLALLFLFVRREGDYYIYAAITVFTSVGSYIVNYFRAKKYCDLRITLRPRIKKHLVPMLVLFASALAIQIYVNSDIVMLGFMTDDNEVGVYSVAVKIYTIAKSVINALVVVAIPRLVSHYAQKQMDQYRTLCGNILKYCLALLIPFGVGLFLLSEEAILIISGEGYIAAAPSLRILSVALLFAVLSNFFGNAILVATRKEKAFLKITIIGGLVNVLLNFVFIPIFGQIGAAITTLVAELIVSALCILVARKTYEPDKMVAKTIIQSVVASAGLVCVYILIMQLDLVIMLRVVVVVILSVVTYFSLMLVQKNEIARDLISKMKARLK